MSNLNLAINLKANDFASAEINKFGKLANANMNKVRKSTNKLSSAFKYLGGVVGYLSAAGLGNMFVDAITQFNRFDSTMSSVGAKARASAVELYELREQAKLLGATKPFSADQVASAQEFLAVAGFSVDSIRTAVPTVLDLAKATGTDLASSSDIASDVLSAFGRDIKNFNNDAAILAGVTVRANTSLTQLGEAAKYVAPVASSLNQDFAEMNAAIGIMANSGIKATQGGTSLRAGLLRLAAPASEGRKQLAQFGVVAVDSAGKMRGLGDILQDLNASLDGLADDKKQDALKKIFGLEASTGMLTLLKSAGTGELQVLRDELNNLTEEDLEKLRAKMTDNLAGDMEKFNSALSAIKISLIEAGEDGFRRATQGASSFLEYINNILIAKPKLASGISHISAVFGGLTKAAEVLAPFGMLMAGFGAMRGGFGGSSKAIGGGIAQAFTISKPLPVIVVNSMSKGINPTLSGTSKSKAIVPVSSNSVKLSRLSRMNGAMKGIGAGAVGLSALSFGSTLMGDGSWQDKVQDTFSTAGGLAGSFAGASMGATLGSVVPVIGTAIGTIAGGILGGIKHLIIHS